LFRVLLLAAVTSVLLDCDRFIEVGELRLDASSVLGRQGFMHCVSFVVLSALVAHVATVVAASSSCCCSRGAGNTLASASAEPPGAAFSAPGAAFSAPGAALGRLTPAARHRRRGILGGGGASAFWLVLVTGLAHTLRDSERRGWWLTPALLGSVRTPGLPWAVVYTAQVLVGGACGLLRAWAWRGV
jgi:hypothetical protein